jgi:hypothetical protein
VLRFVDRSKPPHLMAANAIETELLANCGYTTVSEPGNLVTPATGGQPGSLINRVAPAQPRRRPAQIVRRDQVRFGSCVTRRVDHSFAVRSRCYPSNAIVWIAAKVALRRQQKP